MDYITILEYIGVFAFAVSGAIIAIEEEFDIFGEKYRDIAFPENDIIPKKIKESRIKTNLEKFGYENPFSSSEIIDIFIPLLFSFY